MVSEKLISEIFNHIPFFSKSVHQLIAILLWEVNNDDSNVLSKFQINPVYRLVAMAKTSSGPVKIQQQHLDGANLNVETNACSLDLVRGHLHKEKQPKIISQTLMKPKDPAMQQQNISMQQQKALHISHLTSGT